MQLMLLVITGLSLLLTVAMGAVLWTVLRAERLRSEARVALLRAAAGRDDRRSGDQEGQEGTGDQEIRRDRRLDKRLDRRLDRRPTSPRFPPMEAVPLDDRVTRDPSLGEAVGGMFAAEAPPPSQVRTSLLLAAALSAAVLVLLVLQLAAPAARVAPAPAATERHALELVALQHAPERDGLTISGVARNPAGSVRRTGVLVAAAAIDASGREIGSGQAALDYVVLEPGSESPFVIKVAVAGVASRYRVAFRGTDGTVIAHVDRRSDDVSRHHSPIEGNPWVR